MEGLREERTDDPGIVSKSFRGAFFLSFFPPLPLPFRKKRKEATERKNTEKKREREGKCITVESFEKVSRSEGEGEEGVERRRRKQTGRSSPVEKLRTEMNPSKWTGAFYGPPFLLDRLRDFSESIYQNVPKKELDNEDPWVRGTIPAALGVRNLPPLPFPHFCRVTSMKRQVTSKRNRFFAAKWMVIHWWFYSVYYERLRRTLSGRDYAFLFEDQAIRILDEFA